MSKYRKHRASGQAVVTTAGRDHYLGPHGTKASRIEYDRLITEWLANGRQPVIEPGEVPALTITELVARYWQFAKGYCPKGGKPSGTLQHVKVVLRHLRQSYGHTPAADFGPLAFKVVRPVDIDTTGDVWTYRPESRKTEHLWREGIIMIGPKAQDVLRP